MTTKTTKTTAIYQTRTIRLDSHLVTSRSGGAPRAPSLLEVETMLRVRMLLLVGMLCCIPAISHADAPAPSVTGIPIEVLFSIIGTLILLIYADTRRALNQLQKRAEYRDLQIVRIETSLSMVCSELNLPWQDTRNYHHSTGE